MKYPQLVSMPSTVQDWLDEQLEARGIDAVVYTRYIFSLLQRDTLDLSDDLLTLSSSKSKEVGRRGRKRGRREEYWDVWDCEQLKRSAAVECLMSASDQKFGIEKLVDELCAKLKEIQSEGENHNHSTPSLPSVSEPQSQSPSDLVQKYYAAFPPLTRCSDSSIKPPVLSSDLSSAWGNKKILANSFGKNKLQISISPKSGKTLGATNCAENKENQGRNVDSLSNGIRSRNQIKDKDWTDNAEKELVCPFSWSFTGVWSNENTDLNAFAPSVKAIATGWRISKYNRQNQGEPQGTLSLEDTLSMEGEMWNIGSCNFYGHHVQNELTEDMGNESERIQDYEGESGQNVDENLAQLIAKFDHSIEALWSPESRSENSSPSNRVIGSETPLENTFITCAEQENSGSKNLPVGSLNTSFIRCGTNIKSSIWSSQPSDTVPLATDENKVDLVEQENVSSCLVSDRENNDESQYIDKTKQDVDNLDAVINGTEKVVGSKSNKLGDQVCKKNIAPKNYFPFLKLGSNMAAGNVKMEMGRSEWNKFDGFSSMAPVLPLEECLHPERPNNVWNRRWPTTESSNILTNNFPHYNMFPNCSSFSDGSFGTLNHNREDSSFTEVVPKQSFCNFASDNKFVAVPPSTVLKHSDGIYNVATEGRKTNEVTDNVKDKEEEDLLTSTRTHFRPIRQESSDSHNNNTGCYADGTTFVIPNSLESVPFKRSESGALYLETDLGIETPKKYMEYKEKELYSGRHKAARSPDSVTSAGKDFVPKFRVRQIEKCCQTEASDENATSDEEVDTKRSRQESKENEFYFPGDEHFAEKIVNCLEIDDDHVDHTLESKQPFSMLFTSNNTNDSKLTPLMKQSEQYQAMRTSENVSVSSEEMSYRWSAAVKNCCKCNRNSTAWKTGWLKESHGLPMSRDEIWSASVSTIQSHAWYDIWSGTYDGTGDTCKKCAGVDHTASQDMNPEHMKLREELSLDGEQLLSDLRYVQHLYQGSDSNDSGAGCTEKMQCLSPSSETEASNDVQLYDDSDFGVSQAAPMHCSPSQNGLDGKENESFEDFGATNSRRMLSNKVLLSMEVGAEKKMNERPFSLKMPAKDRKRRHSGCLRQVSDNQHFEAPSTGFPAGREPSAAMGCRLRTIPDTTRLKGSCVPRSLRPVTL
ncbi:uncharacterized protein LOC126276266 isoform X1 [Schistocerca gregaria]|uniref:uncharacterized protein LOC126276266 isoform X1 n=2 Tax=Schistocerca gregaria TaxID=7010 RepID=UPI00211DAF8C|nr:uncharacterized protein LOC126276266 isoform X1 [Schistocerca gregaria]